MQTRTYRREWRVDRIGEANLSSTRSSPSPRTAHSCTSATTPFSDINNPNGAQIPARIQSEPKALNDLLPELKPSQLVKRRDRPQRRRSETAKGETARTNLGQTQCLRGQSQDEAHSSGESEELLSSGRGCCPVVFSSVVRRRFFPSFH